ncbi:glycosyltransferase [Anaerosporobacter faecicola]|uniref:glycosyltransferase n=1 Tax=Anaerosporobacter faecicola TaxID=2718714 RepID=UPI00143B9F99|nr:glycosyltransferase [Anaerosporobacter faecicola]
MKKVIILLSTYNGEKYLSSQLDSILAQDYPNIMLCIRDDGSSDHTIEILDQYVKRYPNVSYYAGHNIGVIKSFFDLIRNAPEDGDYYAMADQDDVWCTNKITEAVKKMEQEENQTLPMLYCAAMTLVDSKLQYVKTLQRKRSKLCLENGLVENLCTGCTSLMNHNLWEKIICNIPTFTVMHDYWTYLVALSVGKVIYDENSYILYRQHSNNTLGTPKNYIEHLWLGLKHYKQNRNQLNMQAKCLKQMYRKMNLESRTLDIFLASKTSWRARKDIIIHNRVYRENRMDNLILKVLIGLGVV